DCAKCDEEEHCGYAGNHDETNVDGTVQALPRTAMRTVEEVVFVVGAHLRSDAGNVVSPACEDIAYYLIHTL
ncbi:MAG TPA: hypothetical protein VH196_04380, partial [Terriglobales bacterium]|nr:hypothetical protein [Terriglobales bacterium]